nr:hypothetical protein [Candidatus Sigynarchaeota archaeon]
MLKILQDLWVVNTGGVVLFQRVFEEKLNAQLFGGFMSALNTFASQLDADGLSSFDIGNKKFILTRKNDLFFVANFDSKANPSKAKKALTEVADAFLKEYQVELLAWRGDTDAFNKFEDTIKDSLQDVVGKFQQAFW